MGSNSNDVSLQVVGVAGIAIKNIKALIVQSMKILTPKYGKISTYTADTTGHALNLHYSALETFKVIGQWIDDTVTSALGDVMWQLKGIWDESN